MTERRTAIFWPCDRPADCILADIQELVAERGRTAQIDGERLVISGVEHYTVTLDSVAAASPLVRLGEDEAAYARQCENRNDATNLLRIILDVAIGALAQYCVFPAPTGFVPDPEWTAVDAVVEAGATFILMPTERAPDPVPFGFRGGKLVNGFTMLMALPMKRYPGEEPPLLSAIRHAEKIRSLESWKRVAESYYDKMYDAQSRGDVSFHREMALDALGDAWKIANELGLEDEAKAIRERQLHIRAVGRQLIS